MSKRKLVYLDDVLKEVEKGICSLKLRIQELETIEIDQPEYKVGDEVWYIIDHYDLGEYFGEPVIKGKLESIHEDIEGIKYFCVDEIGDYEPSKVYKTKEQVLLELNTTKD